MPGLELASSGTGRAMSDGARDLMGRGIAAAKAGDSREARRYLEWALRQDPSGDQELEAWLWLSEVSEDVAQKRHWLELVLASDPTNPRARKKLALLEGKLKAGQLIDPDRLGPPSGADDEAADGDRFLCPDCGARMAFSPDGADLVCDHCGHHALPSEGRAEPEGAGREDFVLTLATARGHRTPVRSRTFLCQGCGVRFLLAPAALSLECPYCGARYVVDRNDDQELIEPQALVPLVLSREEAKERLAAWQAEEPRHRELVNGPRAVYLPVWQFEMGGVIEWRVPAPLHGIQLEEEERLSGAEAPPSPIRVLGSARLSDRLSEAATGYDEGALVPYSAGYLAAWPAEIYSLSVSEAALVARQRALEIARLEFPIKLRRPSLSLRTASMVVVSYQLVLSPVWIAECRVEGRRAGVAIGGQNGALRSEILAEGASPLMTGVNA